MANFKNKGRVMGTCMSVLHGMTFGGIFSGIGCARGMMQSAGRIIPMGLITAILTGILITGVLSAIIGYFISFKKITDSISRKLNVDEFANPFKRAVISALVGDTIMTPLFCFIFVAMNVGLSDPAFLPAFISSLIMDYIIAFVVSLFVGKPFSIISKKISGIED